MQTKFKSIEKIELQEKQQIEYTARRNNQWCTDTQTHTHEVGIERTLA